VSETFEIHAVEFEKSAVTPDHYPEGGLPEIAFVGRSNVGKSSLLNTLVRRKRIAQVSSTPGRTRLVNFFVVNDAFRFVDLPGYGYAAAAKGMQKQWEAMITGYLRKSRNLRGVVALLDIRREVTDLDRKLFEWLRSFSIPAVAVLTKADKLPRSQQAQALHRTSEELKRYAPAGLVLFSATSRQGREELLAEIEKLLTASPGA
jgi:GTP-binding protein